MVGKTNSDVDGLSSRITEDILNLETQIRNLLKSMQVIHNIENVPTLSLPQGQNDEDILLDKQNIQKPEVRMELSDAKRQRRGKTLPREMSTTTTAFEETLASRSGTREVTLNNRTGLSSIQELDLQFNEKASKYHLMEDSVVFVPILDRSVFGMTLVNKSGKKLSAPKVRLSLLPRSTSQTMQKKRQMCRSFLYDIQVLLDETNVAKLNCPLPTQDTFASLNEQSKIVPGGEVLVVANFSHPTQFQFLDLEEGGKLRLLVSVFLDGKQLWARQLLINCSNFYASTIDSLFKKHQLTIIRALGAEVHEFTLERMITESEKYPKRSLERFILPLGYESIALHRTSIDTTVEYYTTNQPSIYWGSYFKIETCSRKPTVARCLVMARSKEQMKCLHPLFQSWLHKQVVKDKRVGFSGLKVLPSSSQTHKNVQNKFEDEIQLIQRLQDVKMDVHCDSEDNFGWLKGRAGISNRNRLSMDSSWIYEYCICLSDTDATFVDKMNE